MSERFCRVGALTAGKRTAGSADDSVLFIKLHTIVAVFGNKVAELRFDSDMDICRFTCKNTSILFRFEYGVKAICVGRYDFGTGISLSLTYAPRKQLTDYSH